MSYPMWNEARTGILVDRGEGILAFIESGEEFESLKDLAGEWHWLDPQPEPDLVAMRPTMECSRLQGRLILGPKKCKELDEIASDPETPWAMRETIQNATVWKRLSQAMTELGYLLGYNDDQMDELFLKAMEVEI